MSILSINELSIIFKKEIKNKKFFLCADKIQRIATLLPLSRALNEAGYITVLGIPEGTDLDNYNIDGINIFYLGGGSHKRLDKYDIFVSSEEALYFAQENSIKIVIHHSLPDRKIYCDYAGMLSSNSILTTIIDYYYIAIRQSKENYNKEYYQSKIDYIFPKDMIKSKRDKLTIIPGGYPKIDSLYSDSLKINKLDRIILCPTSFFVAYAEMYPIIEDTISYLLNKNISHKVVLRPFPYISSIEKLESIKLKFSDHPRFIFDLSATGEYHFLRSLFAITDSSSAAVSFSLSTCRPTIAYQPKRIRIKDRKYDPIGTYACTQEEVFKCIDNYLDPQNTSSQDIELRRNDFIYNPCNSIKYFVDSIPFIIEGKKRKEWLEIDRKAWNDEQPGFKQRHLEFLKSRIAKFNDPRKAQRTYDSVLKFYSDKDIS